MIFVAFATISTCNSQTIESEKVFGGYTYTKDGKNLTMKDLRMQLDTHAESAALFRKARTNNTIASILGTAGGALVGYPVGTAIGGGDANWTLAGIGAGIIAVAIPVSSAANKRAKEAVDTYNIRVNTKEDLVSQTRFHVISNSRGAGLAVQF